MSSTIALQQERPPSAQHIAYTKQVSCVYISSKDQHFAEHTPCMQTCWSLLGRRVIQVELFDNTWQHQSLEWAVAATLALHEDVQQPLHFGMRNSSFHSDVLVQRCRACTNESFMCCCYVKAVKTRGCQNRDDPCFLCSALHAVYVLCWSTGKRGLCFTTSLIAAETQPKSPREA